MNPHPPTRSHLRIYHPNPSRPSSRSKPEHRLETLSSTILPIQPAGPAIATYAVRHNTASDTEKVGLVAGRLYNDLDLDTPSPAEREDGGGEDMNGNDDKGDLNIMDEIRRQRKREQQDLELLSPALLLLHVYPTGSTFLEAPPPPTDNPHTTIRLTRLNHGRTTYPPNRPSTTIPHSTPPNHILIPLDADCEIVVSTGSHTHKLLYQTVEMSIAVPSTSEETVAEVFSTSRTHAGGGAGDDGGGGGEVEGGEVEGGLATPPKGAGKVTRVLDTPHERQEKAGVVKSLMEETQQSVFNDFEPTPDVGSTSPTARRLFSSQIETNKAERLHSVVDDDETGDEEDEVVSTIPADPTTLARSDTSVTSAAVSFIGTLPPSSGGVVNQDRSASPYLELLIADQILPRGEAEGEEREGSEGLDTSGAAEDEMPNSLPEAFQAAEETKKLMHTLPAARTYGHRRGRANRFGRKNMEEREKLEIAESSQPQPSMEQPAESTAQSMEIDEVEQEKQEEKQEDQKGVSPTGKRERLKRSRKQMTTDEITPGKRKRPSRGNANEKDEEETGEGEKVEEAEQEETPAAEAVEKVLDEVRSSRRKKANKEVVRKESKKPPRKRARKSDSAVEDSEEEVQAEEKENNTQYTFHASDAQDTQDSPQPQPTKFKAPAKRSRKSAGSTTTTPKKPAAVTTGSTTHSPAQGSGSQAKQLYTGPPPKVVFSNCSFPDRKDATSILRALGVKKAQKVTDSGVTHLVVGSGGLVRSSKLALALTLGLPIITDSWLLDSFNSPASPDGTKPLLDTDAYIPYDPTSESNWGFSLSAAIERGKSGLLAELLSPYTAVYLTPTLTAHLKSTNQESGFVDILKATGAKKILKRAPKGSMAEEAGGEGKEGIVFAAGEGEKEEDVRRWVDEGGWGVYKVEMLTMSILRGRLEVGEKFVVVPGGEGGDAGGRSQGSVGAAAVIESPGTTATTPAKGRAGGRRKSGR